MCSLTIECVLQQPICTRADCKTQTRLTAHLARLHEDSRTRTDEAVRVADTKHHLGHTAGHALPPFLLYKRFRLSLSFDYKMRSLTVECVLLRRRHITHARAISLSLSFNYRMCSRTTECVLLRIGHITRTRAISLSLSFS